MQGLVIRTRPEVVILLNLWPIRAIQTRVTRCGEADPGAHRRSRHPRRKNTKPKPAPLPAPIVDASPELSARPFRGAPTGRPIASALFGERYEFRRSTGGVVTPEQLRAVELLLETETPLRPLALRAAYECMLRWVENFRLRHPDFRGKPIGERAFFRGCELGTVFFRSPKPSETKPAPAVILNVYWTEDGGHPYEVSLEWQRGAWVIVATQRT